MAHLIIHCQDKEGNLVDVVTSEKKGDEAIVDYPLYQSWITKKDLEQLKGRRPKIVWKIDGTHCPKCKKSEVWDNRAGIQDGSRNAKSPHFSCKDKGCGWAVWGGQYELTEAKPVVQPDVQTEPKPATDEDLGEIFPA